VAAKEAEEAAANAKAEGVALAAVKAEAERVAVEQVKP
jgi:hypothetical protein